jgi:hypothetical protein
MTASARFMVSRLAGRTTAMTGETGATRTTTRSTTATRSAARHHVVHEAAMSGLHALLHGRLGGVVEILAGAHADARVIQTLEEVVLALLAERSRATVPAEAFARTRRAAISVSLGLVVGRNRSVAIVMTVTAAFAHAALSVIAQMLASGSLLILGLVEAGLLVSVACGELGRVASGGSDTSVFGIRTRLNLI